MASVRKVDAVWARLIAELLEARGLPPQLVLRDVGLDWKKVRDPDARIPYAKHVALLEAAAEHLNNPCFGLHFASRVDILDAGTIGYVVANSPKLGDAFRNLVTYHRVHSEGMRPRLEIGDRFAVVSVEIIDPTVRRQQQTYEANAAVIMNLSRFVTGRRLTPERVEFRHNRKDALGEFKRYFGAPVHFGRRRTAVIFKRAHLDLPCRSADERLLRVLKGYCEEILKQRSETSDLKSDIEHLVATLLPSGAPTIPRVAKELGMSQRTLARRLDNLGTSFGQILDGIRHQLALRYLGEPNARASQIAYLLGYSEPSAFNHAFRRWTGVSPSSFTSSG
jgi:AraC-like DNA-binding protein